MPNPRDKIVQEGMRYLLEIIYDDKFSDRSHGFRTKRGCHSALNHMRMTFGYVNWFIEGDISKQFHTIEHGRLISIIRNKIKDQAFIDLLYKAVKVGYGLSNKNVQLNHKGVPRPL